MAQTNAAAKGAVQNQAANGIDPRRQAALETALAQVEKNFGKGSAMRLGDRPEQDVEVIPTGSLALDMALGIGGLPKGRIVEIYGPESSGKTTVALHSVAEAQKLGGTAPLLAGKTVALMFSKASTRTRTSFEVGVYQLGGLGNYMNTAELQAGRGEPLKDTARVLGRYYDCVVWRTYRQSDLEEFAELAGVPVINGLTDYAHPCQVLADLMTIRERRGSLAGRKLCFVGDGSSMANSLIVGGLLAGMQVTCVCPQSYRPAADVLMFAHKYGSAFHLTADPAEGIQDADVVATAVWNTAKPGTPESEQRLRDFVGFQLTGKLLESAKPDVMVLHCLPAHRGEEISTALFEQHADEIFDEAENRLHVQKAVLAVLLAGK